MLVARRFERLEETAREIRAHGGRAETLALDVCAQGAANRIVEAAVRAFGRIDALVNNAGGGAHGELLAQTDTAIEAQWQLHVAAPLRLARAALPHLECARGSMVFIGSGVARVPLPAFGAYAPMKAAIRAAAIQLRRELKSRGIAVTYVDPGVVATEFHARAGVARPRGIPPVSPERVARAILRGIRKRAAVVNAVAWQSAGTIAGEWLGTLTDPIVARLRMAPVTPEEPDAPVVAVAPTAAPESGTPSSVTDFEGALAPVARRMERVKLSVQFVRDALVPGATIELNELAMRWAGMPNKNERAALQEVLDTLAGAGYLAASGDERWRVVRGPS